MVSISQKKHLLHLLRLTDEPEREDRRNMSAYKPKIYRSQDGCCICKAKSSRWVLSGLIWCGNNAFFCSSRFTDSGKYEEDCIGCFKLDQQRSGEICNACVLIVKRWKKLPRNTVKNWAHVVDARTGPGTKNIFKQKKKEVSTPTSPPFEKFKYKHVYKRKPLKIKQIADHEDDIGHLSDASQRSESPLATPFASLTPAFLDNSYWRRQLVCCGVVYVGRLGEVVLDQRLYRPCSARGHSMKAVEKPEQETLATPSEPCSPSSSAFSTSLNPSLIESLVEAELQAFQVWHYINTALRYFNGIFPEHGHRRDWRWRVLCWCYQDEQEWRTEHYNRLRRRRGLLWPTGPEVWAVSILIKSDRDSLDLKLLETFRLQF